LVLSDFIRSLTQRSMIPIVEYPSVVSSYLPAFENVFTRPQMKNFARYTSGLMISPNKTVSAMNDLFYAHNDQSALNNFITDATWSDEELDEARYRVILEGLKRRKNDCEGDGIFVMDDVLSHKTGKQIEYAGKFFDHAEGKYTHAHDILTTHLVKGRLSIPLDFRVYVKEEEFKKKYDEEELPEEIFEDKNQMAREMLKKEGRLKGNTLPLCRWRLVVLLQRDGATRLIPREDMGLPVEERQGRPDAAGMGPPLRVGEEDAPEREVQACEGEVQGQGPEVLVPRGEPEDALAGWGEGEGGGLIRQPGVQW
jgi:hypothetical protein